MNKWDRMLQERLSEQQVLRAYLVSVEPKHIWPLIKGLHTKHAFYPITTVTDILEVYTEIKF